MGKAGKNLKQDQANTAVLQQFWQQYQQEKEQRETHNKDIPELVEFRWLLEELRVPCLRKA